VILFDGDWSRMQMTYTASRPSSVNDADVACFIPTEQNVVGLWKQAAKSASAVVSIGGLSCQLILPPIGPSSSSSTASTLPSGMDSKRDILEHLQKTCSMDFLRSHGLNSSTDVILRKHNKKTILEAWQKWTKLFQEQQQKKQESTAGSTINSKNTGNRHAPILKSILREILYQQEPSPHQYCQNDGASSSPSSRQPLLVVAGTLHESHDAELPCWDEDCNMSSSSSSASLQHQQPMHVCLFLGAVRDMHPYEYDCLHQVVQQQQQQQQQHSSSSTAIRTAPVVCIRLGPVAEFTR
jgi:Basic tilted helix bundle domain